MTDAYIIRRDGAYIVQKVATVADDGRQREVDWIEGLTRDQAIEQASDCNLCRCDD